MDPKTALERARKERAHQVASQRFAVVWRSTGLSQPMLTLRQAAALLGLKPQSLRCYLATGRGTHERNATHPISGEPDLVTVTRLAAPKPPKPRRGRPPKKKLA